MIYLISHRSTSNIALQTIIWFLSFSLKTHNFLQIDAESGSLWTLLCNKKIQHMLLSPCSSTFMSSNNLDYLMLRYGNNQIIMNISCMYRTCALTSDTTPVCYKHRICKQNRISKFSRLTIRACWESRDRISMLRLLVLGTMLDKPFVPRRYFLLNFLMLCMHLLQETSLNWDLGDASGEGERSSLQQEG